MELFPPGSPRGTDPRERRSGQAKQQSAQQRSAQTQRPRQDAPYAPLAANRARLERLRQKKRRRRIRIAVVLAVALAAALAYFTGLYGASIALLGDIVDSGVIALSPGDGFPLDLGMDELIDVQPLAGGFVAVDDRELVMWSASGRELRRIQHGYGDPCITTGNTRVCIYSRGSTALRVEGRRGTLAEKTLDGNILLARMSPNGTLAVFTDKGLEVYNPMFDLIWQWNRLDAFALALTFDDDNRRFATALVESRGGALSSTVYLFETGKDAPVFTFQADDALPVALRYLSGNQLLCVFDTRAVVIDTQTGQQTSSFEFGTRVLQSVSTQSDDSLALLFADVDVSRYAELIILDPALTVVGTAELETRALRVSSDRTHVYVLADDCVYTYGLDGVLYGRTLLDDTPQRLLTKGKLYLFAGGDAMEFHAPSRPAEGEEPFLTQLSGVAPPSDSASEPETHSASGETSQTDSSVAPAA